MAELKDLLVNGESRFFGTTFTYDIDSTLGTVKLKRVSAPNYSGDPLDFTANPSSISGRYALVNDGTGGIKWGTLTSGGLNDLGPVDWRKEFKSIQHRGWRLRPSETLEAYKEAARHGFKYVECDIRKTKDGVYVLLHDEDLEDATNLNGSNIPMNFNYKYSYAPAANRRIENLNWNGPTEIDELTYYGPLKDLRVSYGGGAPAGYDAGNPNGEYYKIATLKDFIIFCKENKLHPYLEIKKIERSYDSNAGSHEGRFFTETEIGEIYDIVAQCGMTNQVTWSSYDSHAIEYINNIDPTARIGYIGELYFSDTREGKTEREKTDYISEINTLIAIRPSKYNIFMCGSASNLCKMPSSEERNTILKYISDSKIPLETYFSEEGYNMYVERDHIIEIFSDSEPWCLSGMIVDYQDPLEILSSNQFTAHRKALINYSEADSKYGPIIDYTNCMTYRGIKSSEALNMSGAMHDTYYSLVTIGGYEQLTSDSTGAPALVKELYRNYANGIASWDIAFNSSIYIRKNIAARHLTSAYGGGTVTNSYGTWAELITSDNIHNYALSNLKGTLTINGIKYTGESDVTMTIGGSSKSEVTLFDINDYKDGTVPTSATGDEWIQRYSNGNIAGFYCNGLPLTNSVNVNGSTPSSYRLVPDDQGIASYNEFFYNSQTATGRFNFITDERTEAPIMANRIINSMNTTRGDYNSPNSALLWVSNPDPETDYNLDNSFVAGVYNKGVPSKSKISSFKSASGHPIGLGGYYSSASLGEYIDLMTKYFPFKAIKIYVRFPYGTACFEQPIMADDGTTIRRLGNFQGSAFISAGDSQPFGGWNGVSYFINWRLVPIFYRSNAIAPNGKTGQLKVYLQVTDAGYITNNKNISETDYVHIGDSGYNDRAVIDSTNVSNGWLKTVYRHNVGYSVFKVVGVV